MAIDRKEKFTIMSPDEVVVSPGLSIPKHLKPIVANAPQGDKAIGQYLAQQVSTGEITLDDVDFLIASGALI